MAQVLSGMKKPRPRRANKETLSVTRTFGAPRERVWEAWIDPAMVRRWWGPSGFTSPDIRIDLRVGGKYLFCMRSPDGKDYWNTGVYREIVPMERLVATDSFSDEKGEVVPPSYYGMTGDMPMELLATLTFQEQEGKTKFTIEYEGFPPGEMAVLAKAGWNQSLDKLADLLVEEEAGTGKPIIIADEGRPDATLVRIFDAPQERIFRAYTEPDLIQRWWGPRRLSTVVDRLEAGPGGSWRFLNRDAAGNEYWFHGVFHEVSPARIVQTFEFEGMPGHAMLGVVTLVDMGGKTKLTSKSIFESVGDRDGMLATGKDGWLESMDRLAELVEEPETR
ncbi:MAG TPA: SRPBCC domain-containing protein [Methanoregula sp.]|nr:SRPBCC domain-containing protein [Methanoregula sp.]